MAAIQCPACGATLRSKTEIPPGKRVKCLKCGKGFVVPAKGEAAAPTPAEPNPLSTIDGGGATNSIIKAPPRKRGSGLLLALIGGFLMLCCCCTVVPASGWFFRDKLTSLVGGEGAADGKKDGKKDGKEVKKDKTEEPPVTPPDGAPEKLNLVDFAKEWNAEPKKASARYKGRTVELSGAIRGYSFDGERKPLMLIETDPAPNALVIHAATKVKEPWALADIRQTVNIRGKFKDDAVPLVLEAEFVTVPESKTPVYKAALLAAEAAKDPNGFKGKYKDKTMIVVGEVVKLDSNDEHIILKGADERPLQFYCAAVPKPALGSLVKIGQEARLYCMFKGEFPDRDFNPHKALIAFSDALPITGTK